MIEATIRISLPDKIYIRLLWLFSTRRYRLRLPETWEEVPRKKLKKIFTALMQQGQHDETTVRLLILRALLPVPSWLFFRLPWLDIVEKLEPVVVWFLVTPIAVPVLPTVRTGRQRWRLPAPAARDLSLQQYLAIEQEWGRMARGENDIPALLATILRPENEATHESLHGTGLLPGATRPALRQWAIILAKLHPAWVYYVVQYWAAQRESLQQQYPAFFSGKGEKEGPLDWESIPARIAEAGVFGPVHQVLLTPARTYLAWANARQQDEGQQTQTGLQELIRANHKKFVA